MTTLFTVIYCVSFLAAVASAGVFLVSRRPQSRVIAIRVFASGILLAVGSFFAIGGSTSTLLNASYIGAVFLATVLCLMYFMAPPSKEKQ